MILRFRCLLIALLLFGCSEPNRPAAEEDRAALEAQAAGDGCGFRSSLSADEIRTTFRMVVEPGECRTGRSLLTSLNPGTLGCRVHAIYCLAFLPRSVQSLPALISVASTELLVHDWAGVRRENVHDALVYALSTADDERAVPILLSFLRPSEPITSSILRALEKLGAKARSAGPRLRELASAERGVDRIRYLEALLKVDPENSRELFEECLEDDSASVRQTALQALDAVGLEVVARHFSRLAASPELQVPLLRMLPRLSLPSEVKHDFLRSMIASGQELTQGRAALFNALEALKKLPSLPPDICQALVELTRGSNLFIVQRSYEALGVSCHDYDAALEQAAEDAVASESLKRHTAAKYLGRVLDRASSAHDRFFLILQRLAGDSAPSVRKAAKESLKKLNVPETPAIATERVASPDALRRDRALYDIAEKALRISTLRARFKGNDGHVIEGTILSTLKDQHRIEKRGAAKNSESELSSYAGHEEWTILTFDWSQTYSRQVRRDITSFRSSPPFTPLLMVWTSPNGVVHLDKFASFDGKEWLTEYSFLGDEIVEGQSCYLFESHSGYNRYRLWISKQMGVLCKQETYGSEENSNEVENRKPAESITYFDHELNVSVALADLVVQPEKGEVVDERSYLQNKNGTREYVWKGFDQ